MVSKFNHGRYYSTRLLKGWVSWVNDGMCSKRWERLSAKCPGQDAALVPSADLQMSCKSDMLETVPFLKVLPHTLTMNSLVSWLTRTCEAW